MERLTRRITDNVIELSAKANPINYNGSPQRVHIKHPFWNVFNRLCNYEDAEEKGLLVRVECSCKDCVHVDYAGCTGATVYCMKHEAYMNEDDFCIHAEKMKGEEHE